MHAPLYQIEKIILESADFLKKNTDWLLKIAGQGPNTPALEKLALENLPLGSYQFVGFLNSEQNKANYQSATIYISIPISDGTSISLLEAMAYGCIPIVSDLPANKEWITHLENGIISDGDVMKDIEIALTLDPMSIEEKNKVILFRQFDPQAPNSEVPDPWYGGVEGFENVFQIVRENTEIWVSRLC